MAEKTKNISTIDKSQRRALKLALIKNATKIFEDRNEKLNYKEITDKLNKLGTDIQEFAVRSWFRDDDRVTFPSIVNLRYLATYLQVDLNFLLGIENPAAPQTTFYEPLRFGNEKEKKILSVLLDINKTYYKGDPNDYEQKPLDSIFTYDTADKLDEFSFYQLLFTNLVRFKPKAIRRDKQLEKELRLKFIKKENKHSN